MKGGDIPDGDDLGRSEESGLLSSWHESLQLQSTQGTGQMVTVHLQYNNSNTCHTRHHAFVYVDALNCWGYLHHTSDLHIVVLYVCINGITHIIFTFHLSPHTLTAQHYYIHS